MIYDNFVLLTGLNGQKMLGLQNACRATDSGPKLNSSYEQRCERYQIFLSKIMSFMLRFEIVRRLFLKAEGGAVEWEIVFFELAGVPNIW